LTLKGKARFLEDNRRIDTVQSNIVKKPYVSFYVLDDMEDYFFGYMVPSTGYLSLFRVEYDNDGLCWFPRETTSPTSLEDHELPQKLFQYSANTASGSAFLEWTMWKAE
jgi:uridine kinase